MQHGYGAAACASPGSRKGKLLKARSRLQLLSSMVCPLKTVAAAVQGQVAVTVLEHGRGDAWGSLKPLLFCPPCSRAVGSSMPIGEAPRHHQEECVGVLVINGTDGCG